MKGDLSDMKKSLKSICGYCGKSLRPRWIGSNKHLLYSMPQTCRRDKITLKNLKLTR